MTPSTAEMTADPNATGAVVVEVKVVVPPPIVDPTIEVDSSSAETDFVTVVPKSEVSCFADVYITSVVAVLGIVAPTPSTIGCTTGLLGFQKVEQ